MSVNSRTMRRLSHDAHGFTLIETLVAMISGVVVTGAAFTIFIVALHQTSRVTDSVQATQLGRTAMTHVVDELHSACIARAFKPVQATSGEKELIFENAYSKEAVIPKAYEHQIVWNEATGTLTDFVYESKVESGSEWPNFKFPALDYSSATHEAANAEPKKGVLLASNVTKTSGATPIFQYYEYGEEYTSSSSTPLSTLTKMTPPRPDSPRRKRIKRPGFSSASQPPPSTNRPRSAARLNSAIWSRSHSPLLHPKPRSRTDHASDAPPIRACNRPLATATGGVFSRAGRRHDDHRHAGDARYEPLARRRLHGRQRRHPALPRRPHPEAGLLRRARGRPRIRVPVGGQPRLLGVMPRTQRQSAKRIVGELRRDHTGGAQRSVDRKHAPPRARPPTRSRRSSSRKAP